MKILVTNLRLNHFAGSEIWTYHVVEELILSGHEVELYTKQIGDIYERLLILGALPLKSKSFDLGLFNHYDCIEDLSNLHDIKFGYKIQTCHGIFPPPEQPHHFVNKYVSISKEVQSHLSNLDFKSDVLNNPVNLNRYQRITSVHDKVKSMLILCVGKEAQDKCSQAAKRMGIKYEIHSKWKDPVFDLENKINQFDLCIGYGRGIIESICCGRNAIVYDSRRYTPFYADGLLTKDNFDHALSNNFSGRASMIQYHGVNQICDQIEQANKSNADWIYDQRELFNVRTIVNKYLSYV